MDANEGVKRRRPESGSNLKKGAGSAQRGEHSKNVLACQQRQERSIASQRLTPEGENQLDSKPR